MKETNDVRTHTSTMLRCFVFGFLFVVTGATWAEAPPRPNVVIIFADDLGYGDLGSFGHPYIRTPHIDALAAAGQRWTDFYVAASICSPSRAALLTGRLPVRTGMYGELIGVYFPNDPGGLPDAEVTLAEALRGVGYRTAIAGKWHLGDRPAAWPTRHGFDQWLGIPYSNDMDWVGELNIDEMFALRAAGKNDEVAGALAGRGEKYQRPKIEYWNVPLYASRLRDATFADETVERPVDQTQITKRYTQAAVEFIATAKDDPFFLYVPHSMPHTPLFRSDAFAGASLGGRYGDVIEELDWSVGQIVGALRRHDLTEHTLVIFTSDNGPWLSMRTEGGRAGLLRDGKGTTFEGGMRVPMALAWPGTIPTGVVSEVGSTLDLFATITRLAGVDAETANRGVDGVDLAGTLLTGEPSPRTDMPFYRRGELYAYRSGSWKVHLITQGNYGLGPARTEHDPPLLYHLRDDPSERFDVASVHPEVVTEMMAKISAHRANVTIRPPEFDRRLGPR